MGVGTSILNAGMLNDETPLEISDSQYKGRRLFLENLEILYINDGTCSLIDPKEVLLARNMLQRLPMDIGFFSNLTYLDVSSNRLTELPHSIKRLKNLVFLDASNNLLEDFPLDLCELKGLSTLLLNYNEISEAPEQIAKLKNLNVLELSFNNIEYLPAELLRLNNLRVIKMNENPCIEEFENYTEQDPPSLLELTARWFIRFDVYYENGCIPDEVKRYLGKAKKCSFCDGPYFQTYIKRGKFESRTFEEIPFLYKLCSSHWNSEKDRVRSLFQPSPITAPAPVTFALPSQLASSRTITTRGDICASPALKKAPEKFTQASKLRRSSGLSTSMSSLQLSGSVSGSVVEDKVSYDNQSVNSHIAPPSLSSGPHPKRISRWKSLNLLFRGRGRENQT
eukprot:Nk52_evm8s349 gene=Nk52_evmTU8s349